uniref:Uncharacterized protein n=1 Tax=Kalanchoe fedtschenkoi TaxID=63787 RepID=A0A7N0VIW1_KALFE
MSKGSRDLGLNEGEKKVKNDAQANEKQSNREQSSPRRNCVDRRVDLCLPLDQGVRYEMAADQSQAGGAGRGAESRGCLAHGDGCNRGGDCGGVVRVRRAREEVLGGLVQRQALMQSDLNVAASKLDQHGKRLSGVVKGRSFGGRVDSIVVSRPGVGACKEKKFEPSAPLSLFRSVSGVLPD